MTTSEMATVLAWHDALNAGDVDTLLSLSSDDIEIGDPKHKPNPCLGRVETAPFYAIKIYPGDGSTTVGLKIDAQCRVIGTDGAPVEGLFAAGLDANSIWRGQSPAHGCNVGPAMVTGFIAGKAMAETLVLA